MRPKGLGRGLDALLAGTDDAAPSKEALQNLAIDRLKPGRFQPRTRMDDASLAELADSIREQGVMQPILVRPVEGGRFEIIGHPRLVTSSPESYEVAVQQRLWAVSEDLTGVKFPVVQSGQPERTSGSAACGGSRSDRGGEVG